MAEPQNNLPTPPGQAAARILQLECILEAKERELDLVRREYATGQGGHSSNEQAHASAEAAAAAANAENARLRRRIAELEGEPVLAYGGAGNAIGADSSLLARAVSLSHELTQVLTSAAAAGAAPLAGASPTLPDAGAAAAATPSARAGADADQPTAPLPGWLSLVADSGGAAARRVPADESNGTGTKHCTSVEEASTRPSGEVVALNVSGANMDALLAALTHVVPDSRLARMFGRDAKAPGAADAARKTRAPDENSPAAASTLSSVRLPRDSQGRVFLPYPPDCFAAVLDLLHALTWLPRDGGGQGMVVVDGPPSASWLGGAGGGAAASSAAATPAALPPPPLWGWWRDRVQPSREPILRQLMADLGLQSLLGSGPGAPRWPHTGVGDGAVGGAAAAATGPADLPPGHQGSVGNMYERLAALGRG